jgi:hypothetical protein
MMKSARLLCALWVCGPLALDARAADSPPRNGAAVAPAKWGAAAASPRRPSVVPPRAAGLLARSNAERLHSLHPAKARGNTALTANPRVGPKVAATSAAASTGASARASARDRGIPRIPSSAKAMVRGSTIGGPRAAAGTGQLGGAATGRNARNTAIDGTQVRHKT